MTVIQEEGLFGGPIARAVAGRVGQARERIGELREQFQQDQGQWGRAQQDSQMGRLASVCGRAGARCREARMVGRGHGDGPGRGGAPEGIRFQTRANCTTTHAGSGPDRIGNTFCRGSMRLG